MSSYQYRKSHCGDKTVIISSYLHNGISYTGKMTSLYWIRTLVTIECRVLIYDISNSFLPHWHIENFNHTGSDTTYPLAMFWFKLPVKPTPMIKRKTVVYQSLRHWYHSLALSQRHWNYPLVRLCPQGFYPRPVLASGIVVACVYVCVSINHELVCAIIHQPFKLGSPNLDQICKTPL